MAAVTQRIMEKPRQNPKVTVSRLGSKLHDYKIDGRSKCLCGAASVGMA